MKPIFTHVDKDEANILHFGLFDRMLYRLVHFLNDWHERRTNKAWEKAE